MFRTSHAMLKTYKDCPQRYKFIYIDQLQSKFKVAKPEFTMGQHVHTALKKLLADVPQQQRTPEKAREILKRVWTTNRSGFDSREQEAQYGKRALTMLETFLQAGQANKTIQLEHNIQYLITDGLMLSGRVDRLDQDEGGMVQLIDYKTGQFNPEYVDRGQLAIYSVLVVKGMNLPIISASYWYLEQNQFVSYQPSDSDISIIIDEVIRQAEYIQADQQFPARPSVACSWCEFIDICPARSEALTFRKDRV